MAGGGEEFSGWAGQRQLGGVIHELCLNNEELSHEGLRKEPPRRGWMRCLKPARVLAGFWIRVVETSQGARGDGKGGRFSLPAGPAAIF